MNFILEVFWTLWLIIYYWMESIILFFIPKSMRIKKNVVGEVVLITGAGSGFGRLMTLKFAEAGARCILVDINKDSIDQVANEAKKLGAEAYGYKCDLSARNEVYEMANKIKEEVGCVDILINNAGIVTGKKILESPDGAMVKTMEVNTMAHFWTTKAFLPAMMEKNHGHVVTVSSTAGLAGVTGLVDYCASKFAAVGFDESLRFEIDALGKSGVHTTLVCPFYMNTGMFEGAKSRFPNLLPMLEPEYVRDVVYDAIRTNQSVLCIPRLVYFLIAIKSFLPVAAFNVMGQFLGVNEFMDDFVGRQRKTN